MQRPITQYAKSGDVHIAYQVVGDGPVDLLYAQGWVSNVEYAWENPDYARFLTRLGRSFRVIFFDKRGTGMSDREVDAATLEERIEDITAVLDAAGSKQAAICGSSEGGNMAAVFAATHPERASHLVLCGCRARRAWAPDYPWGTTEEAFEAEIEALLRDWGKPFDLEGGAPSKVGDPAAEAWFAAYLRYSASPSGVVAHSRWQFQTDIRDVLPTITTPTLVLHREGDLWCSVDEATYLAGLIPGAQLTFQPGIDHIMWWGDQDRTIEAIEEFVTGHSASAAINRVLATLLMVDIVGSTAKLSEVGDAGWRALLDNLEDKMRQRARDHGGQWVNSTGDGALMSFPGPTRAVECARALMRDAAALGVGLRCGVHTGEVERHPDGLRGVGVHMAARVMAVAGEGQITASATVRDLSTGAGLSFASLGSHDLKGIDGPRDLFEVT